MSNQDNGAASVDSKPSPNVGSLPPPDQIAAAMQSIDVIAGWLDNTGLSEAAIAQWKYNALASAIPALGKLAESAKSLIGSTTPIPETGLTVTELAELLTESCERKIKAADVNQALVELGLQIRKGQEREYELTRAGLEFGQAFLATSKTNDWSGPRVKWFKSVLPLLEDYFKSASINEKPDSQEVQSPQLNPIKASRYPRDSNNSSTKEREVWFIQERAKHLEVKVNANHLIHIELFANDAYKERHGKLPNRQLFRKTQAFAYPVGDVDLLDAAIKGVVARG